MANNLFVSYDLHEPGKNYDKVAAAIKQLGGCVPAHLSFWYVKSNYSATQAVEHIWKSMDSSDKVLVVDATNHNASWQNLPDDVAKFIQQNWTR